MKSRLCTPLHFKTSIFFVNVNNHLKYFVWALKYLYFFNISHFIIIIYYYVKLKNNIFLHLPCFYVEREMHRQTVLDRQTVVAVACSFRFSGNLLNIV